jgi:hypothetical protein
LRLRASGPIVARQDLKTSGERVFTVDKKINHKNDATMKTAPGQILHAAAPACARQQNSYNRMP